MDDPIVKVPFWALKYWSINFSNFKHIPGVESKPLRLKDKPKIGAKSNVQKFITKKSRIKPECLPLVEKMLKERLERRANMFEDPDYAEVPFWMVKNFKPEPKWFILKLYKYAFYRLDRGKIKWYKVFAPLRFSFDRKKVGQTTSLTLYVHINQIRPECLPSLVRLLNKRLINFHKKYLEEQKRLAEAIREEMQRRKNTPVEQDLELLFRE